MTVRDNKFTGFVMRKKKAAPPPIHGWLAVDKPAGITSATVCNRIKRLTGGAKTGHGGTLDPLATGILPVALGEATKTVPYVMDGAKKYRFTIRWGEARDTDDAEGEVIATSDVRPDRAIIEAILPRFVGEIDQVPPIYSAIKIDGQRAYDLARADTPPEMVARKVRIDGLSLVQMTDPDHAVFEADCGKGTYMRSLARDIAVAAGTVGHIAVLRRTAVGGFNEGNAIGLDFLESLGHIAPAFEHLLPIETALADIPALALTASETAGLRLGQAVPLFRTADLARVGSLSEGTMLRAVSDGKVIALVRLEAARAEPVRVFNH